MSKPTAVEVIEYLREKTAAGGYTGMFNANITSPIALAALAGPSLYHMATGNEASDDTKDLAEVGGLGMLIHGELPAFARSIATRGRA